VVVAELPFAVIVENDTEFITLSEAARLAGYSSPRTLQVAAKSGRLKSKRIGPRAIVTTRLWLDEFLDDLKANMSHRRGGADDEEEGD
jgi:hypothetical protein